MEKKITSFVRFSDKESLDCTVKSLKDSGVVDKIVIVTGIDSVPDFKDPEITYLKSEGFSSTDQ